MEVGVGEAASGGAAVATRTVLAVGVNSGICTVVVDFGPVAFNGDPRWLAHSVRTNGASGWVPLLPRQAITATPYALRAANAALLSGQGPAAFAPATNSSQYVSKLVDNMTGPLNLP